MTSSNSSDSTIDSQSANNLLYILKKFASKANPVQPAESFLANIINGNDNSDKEELSFHLKIGKFEKKIIADPSNLSLKVVRSLANDFIKELFPDKDFSNIEDKLVFSIYHPTDKCLKQFNAISDIIPGSYLIIDLSKRCLPNVNGPSHPQHDLDWNTYLSPTNCDLCSKLLIGNIIFRQGKQCKRCKRNYHESCSTNLSNDWCIPSKFLRIDNQTKTSACDSTTNLIDKVKKGINVTSEFLGFNSDESDEESNDTNISHKP